MELRAYWRLLRRRWLVVVIPAAVVVAVALLTYRRPPERYNVGVRFIAGQAPTEATGLSDESRLANWQASEYIVNTLRDWVQGGQFAEMVSQRLAEQGLEVPLLAVRDSTSADNARSLLIIYMSYGDAQVLEAMMQAAAEVLIEENDRGLPQLGGQPAELIQLDEPIVNQVPLSIWEQMELPFRVLLGLVAGIGLALLVDYLDPTVRYRQDLETIGLSVIGAIPPGRRAR